MKKHGVNNVKKIQTNKQDDDNKKRNITQAPSKPLESVFKPSTKVTSTTESVSVVSLSDYYNLCQSIYPLTRSSTCYSDSGDFHPR